MINEYIFENGIWKRIVECTEEDKVEFKWIEIPISDVPYHILVDRWETLLLELSTKEIKLWNLKETIFDKEQLIIRETDFKDLYGKNNSDVRKEHLRKVMNEDYVKKADLEFSIDYLRRYLVLLHEIVHHKKEL